MCRVWALEDINASLHPCAPPSTSEGLDHEFWADEVDDTRVSRSTF
jgi:hypothetical protein